jgi:hypothetical protein
MDVCALDRFIDIPPFFRIMDLPVSKLMPWTSSAIEAN